jgi:hypothetical protein
VWEFFEVVLAIVLAGWLLDQEPPPRPGALRLVKSDANPAERDDVPGPRRTAPRLW